MNSAVLQPPLPDHSFSADQECIDHHIGGHAHHNSFASGAPDQLRRDGALATPGFPLSSITSRFNSHRPDSSYQTAVALSDSSSGSISTSPSSNGSSALTYSYATFPSSVAPSYPSQFSLANNYSSFNSGYSTMSSNRRMSTLNDASSSAMLPPTRSPGLGHPVSPQMGGVSTRDNYTTGTSGLHRHSHALSPRSDLSRYGSLPDTPRVLPTTMPLPTYTSYPSSVNHYGQHQSSGECPPFTTQDNFGTITSDGVTITPSIDAKVEKGFFYSPDRVWTCYRRNYFAVNVSFNLTPWTPNSRLYHDPGNGKPVEQIQSFAVSLAAAVDASAGKIIELVQHTPKRDKAPQLTMKKELLAPTPPGKNHEHGNYGLNNTFHQTSTAPGPTLPLQNETESSQHFASSGHSSTNYQHSFERIQFKSATANNGKRRAQQQYYHLIVELWANIQNPRDADPKWVKIAAKSSSPVVVRGRSPSHYQNEGPHNASAPRGAPGPGLGGAGHPGLGSSARSSYTGYSNGLSGGGGTGMGGSMYRGNTTYSLDPSPVGSHSVSSASSLSGGPVEGLVGDQHMVEDEDSKMMDAPHDYSYYPAPIYESIPSKMETTLPLPDRRIKDEYSGSNGSWQVGSCGRFQGMETSRGYYHDVPSHATY